MLIQQQSLQQSQALNLTVQQSQTTLIPYTISESTRTRQSEHSEKNEAPKGPSWITFEMVKIGHFQGCLRGAQSPSDVAKMPHSIHNPQVYSLKKNLKTEATRGIVQILYTIWSTRKDSSSTVCFTGDSTVLKTPRSLQRGLYSQQSDSTILSQSIAKLCSTRLYAISTRSSQLCSTITTVSKSTKLSCANR